VHVVGYKRSLAVSSGVEHLADRWLSVPFGWLPALIDRRDHRPRDLRLTIDADWQRAAHRALGEKRGAIVVLDADTGAVVASVSRPGFDPEGLGANFRSLRDHPAEPFLDRTRALSPPGSTFKLLLARHLLAEGESGASYFCPGRIATEGGRHIRCPSPHGQVDLARALELSCNGYFVRMAAEAVGGSPLDAFREVLGEGFPGESDLGHPMGRALLVIGQGNARVAPVRMASLVATHFGDQTPGAAFRPHLVVEGPRDVGTVDWSVPVAREPVRTRLAEMMEASGRPVGQQLELGGRCQLLGAKTGTAETPSEEDYGWLVGALRIRDEPERTLAFAIVVEGIRGFSIQHTPGVLSRMLRRAMSACS
jgi:peptidoglycan glycosyltransferase